MTQKDFGNLDPDTTSGTDLSENILEPWRDALHSCHRGSTRPSYAPAGMMWIDDSATPWLIKVYTGSVDCIIGSIAPSTGVFNVRSDVISEATSGNGVTVDGVLLKDTAIVLGSPTGGNKGAGTLNAAGGLFDKGSRALSAGNNGPLYAGLVATDTSASGASIAVGPNGWTASVVDASNGVRITHNLGLSNPSDLIVIPVYLAGSTTSSLIKDTQVNVGDIDPDYFELVGWSDDGTETAPTNAMFVCLDLSG